MLIGMRAIVLVMLPLASVIVVLVEISTTVKVGEAQIILATML